MSSYMHFFLRSKDEFAHLCSFSRSSYIYQNFNWLAPYEKIIAVKATDLEIVKGDLERTVKSVEASLTRVDKDISRVERLESGISARLDALRELDDERESIEDELAQLRNDQYFVWLLEKSMTERKYSKEDYVNGEYVDAAGVPVRENEFLYVGIDCGSVVSVQDIADPEWRR